MKCHGRRCALALVLLLQDWLLGLQELSEAAPLPHVGVEAGASTAVPHDDACAAILDILAD